VDPVTAHADVIAVTQHCHAVLDDPDGWFVPDGWPDSLTLRVIDATWSLVSPYETVVRPLIRRYCAYQHQHGRDPRTDSLHDLTEVYAEVGGPEGFALLVRSQRPAHTRPRAPLRAATVLYTAQSFLNNKVATTGNLLAAVEGDHEAVKWIWTSIPGNGVAGWRYLLMLAGHEGSKPDRMIARFVADALCVPPNWISPIRAAALVEASADEQHVSRRLLDHTIWRYQSALAKATRRKGSNGQAAVD
jgi:hypothetical protein